MVSSEQVQCTKFGPREGVLNEREENRLGAGPSPMSSSLRNKANQII
jgi:hypothetical protein